MKKLKLTLFIFFILSILLAACEIPGGPTLQPTLSAEDIYRTAGITIVPTSTPVLPTATPTPNPSIQLHSGYNPLYLYPETGALMKSSIQRGQEFEVTGRNADSSWLLISFDPKQTAWLPVSGLDLVGAVDLSTQPVVDPYPVDPPAVLNWKGNPVKTLCLSEQTTFTGTFATDHPTDTPEKLLSDSVLAAMHAAGIRTVKDGACDATLTIATTIDPRGKQFTEAITGTRRYCYSGVTINSDWLLTQGTTQLKFNLKKMRGTVDHPLYCTAPGRYHAELAFVAHTGLNKLWGAQILIPMLQINDLEMNNNAIYLAGASGRYSMDAVPALIPYLENPDHAVEALSALKTITGKGFRNDSYAWKTWWQTSQSGTATSTP